jgi:hypothetical protein
MKKMEVLSMERSFYKVAFVVSGTDVRIRLPSSTTARDGALCP